MNSNKLQKESAAAWWDVEPFLSRVVRVKALVLLAPLILLSLSTLLALAALTG